MGKRREPRKPVQITVRILGTDANGRPFAEKVDGVDVSRSGLHVRGLSVALKLDDTVSVSYKDQKARYRVKWVVPSPLVPGGRPHWEAGLQNPSPERNIFDFPLPDAIFDNYTGRSFGRSPGALPEALAETKTFGAAGVPAAISTGERRVAPRLRCTASAELHPEGRNVPIMTGIADLSLGGCFVDMPMPLAIGTRLKAVLWLDGVKVQFSAIVSNTRPGFGMGLHFQNLPADEQARLRDYIAKIPRYPFQEPR